MRGYTQAQKEYLSSFKDSGLSYTEIAKLFNEKFNEHKDRGNIRQVCVYYLNFDIRSKTPHKYTEEEKAFLKSNVESTYFDVLTKMFNETFNHNLSCNAIKSECGRLGLKNNCPGGFMGSEQHWTKGLTKEERKAHFTKQSYENCLKGLRKGQTSIPLSGTVKCGGKERIIVESANGKGKNVWSRSVDKSRFLYEQTYGKIPNNSVIIHLDGNRKNYDLSNLMCVTHSEFSQLVLSPNYGKGKITEAMLEIIKTKKVLKELKENK